MPPAVRRSLLAIVVLAGALALPAVAPAGTGSAGLSPIDPSSENAHGITAIWWFALAWAGVIFLLVTVPLVVFIVRYRSGGRARDAEGPQVHGSTRLELAWTAFPIAVIIILGAFTFWKLGDVNDPAGAAGSPGEVLVQGRQFYWQFVYPNGAISINELRLPGDQVTALKITAPENDVIHSFWAPALGPKRDAIPGKVNTLKLKPETEGSYEIRCAELCGLQHAVMDGTVRVVPPAEYTAWVDALGTGQKTKAGSAALGKEIFQGACATCHGLSGEGLVGPPLAGVASNVATVEQVVRHGRNTMPAVGQGWSNAELHALTAYLTQRFGSASGSPG
jgi:cytochrome c oxidase subunit 2